tara:strand:+ start:4204 stop:4641 length:438 start_codon:yes stop_codon:yes gene_type:complete
MSYTLSSGTMPAYFGHGEHPFEIRIRTISKYLYMAIGLFIFLVFGPSLPALAIFAALVFLDVSQNNFIVARFYASMKHFSRDKYQQGYIDMLKALPGKDLIALQVAADERNDVATTVIVRMYTDELHATQMNTVTEVIDDSLAKP